MRNIIFIFAIFSMAIILTGCGEEQHFSYSERSSSEIPVITRPILGHVNIVFDCDISTGEEIKKFLWARLSEASSMRKITNDYYTNVLKIDTNDMKDALRFKIINEDTLDFLSPVIRQSGDTLFPAYKINLTESSIVISIFLTSNNIPKEIFGSAGEIYDLENRLLKTVINYTNLKKL